MSKQSILVWGTCHVMIWRGGRDLSKLYLTIFLFKSYWDHFQVKWRPDPSPVISCYFPSLTKEKDARDLRGRNWKEEEKSLSSQSLYFFPFRCYLSQQLSYVSQQEGTSVTHCSMAGVSLFWFYHILRSSGIWTDAGQHEIYLFDRKATGSFKNENEFFSFHWSV